MEGLRGFRAETGGKERLIRDKDGGEE